LKKEAIWIHPALYALPTDVEAMWWKAILWSMDGTHSHEPSLRGYKAIFHSWFASGMIRITRTFCPLFDTMQVDPEHRSSIELTTCVQNTHGPGPIWIVDALPTGI
jgi:hypothetical protein